MHGKLLNQNYTGGLFVTEFGTNDVGLPSAGWAARAQDPTTLFGNPAGMSLLPEMIRSWPSDKPLFLPEQIVPDGIKKSVPLQ